MRRVLAPLAGLLVLSLAVPSHAGSFSYTDPADMPANGGLDILSVTYATTGKGKGKAYVPSTLTVALTLGAAPVEQPFVRYKVGAEAEGCGAFVFSYTAGTVYSGLQGPASLFLGCGSTPGDPTGGSGQILFPKYEVKGSTITWSVGIKALPKEVRAGTTLTSMEATVDIVEPVLGIQGLDESGGPGLLDNASTAATWKIS